MNKVKNLYFNQSMLKIYIMYDYHNFFVLIALITFNNRKKSICIVNDIFLHCMTFPSSVPWFL